jgi:arylsulfatase A-like enzyme
MSILTGRYTTNHLVGLPSARHNLLDPAIPTLAEILKEHGYVTAAVTGGRWVSPEWFKRGFLQFRISGKNSSEFLWDLEENLEAVRRLLDSHGSERLFLFFHTYKPHAPYLGRFFLLDERIPSTPNDFLSPYNNVVVAKALYDGDIKITDAYIGLLLQLLEKKGVLNNAIVVLTSDHGEAFAEHGRRFRFHSWTLFDEELHVPLVLVYPPQVPTGRTVENLTRTVDLMPTILDLLGISPPIGFDGRSLRPLWEGRVADDRTVLIDEAKEGEYASAKGLRTSRYKLIGFPDSHNGTIKLDMSRSALYDLKADPGEKVNRLAELPEVANRLAKAVLRAFKTQESNLAASRERGEGLKVSKERLKQLKALGYVQ